MNSFSRSGRSLQQTFEELPGQGAATKPTNQQQVARCGRPRKRRNVRSAIGATCPADDGTTARFGTGGALCNAYKDITVHDLILGDVTVKAEEHDDIIIRKGTAFRRITLPS